MQLERKIKMKITELQAMLCLATIVQDEEVMRTLTIKIITLQDILKDDKNDRNRRTPAAYEKAERHRG